MRRDAGDVTVPRVRAGTIHIPAGQARGRVRVVVRLPLPPLAASGRTLAARGAARRLNVASASSRAYLARLARVQRAAAATLRRTIPEATISRRFRIVLDGMAVELPARRLPALARLPFVENVYPSVRYTRALNDSPAVVGAHALAAATGARGQGIKIAIVDDGIDQRNPFFNPQGFSYPAGFPKGARRWTTPKVIVARAFPGPGSGRRGRLALDPRASFHGTHVAGIASGQSGTDAPAGNDHPAVRGLSGVAPRAWLGNYRVFSVPSPIGHIANSPEIVAAFEAAVRDGMDVINFSGGGSEIDPANDVIVEAVRNVVAAGVVPVISAGNDRDEFGLGTAGSPGTAPDAISVGAVSNMHVFAPALSVVAPTAPETLRRIPFVGAGGGLAPASWNTSDQTLVDVGSVLGPDGRPVDRYLCGPPSNPNGPGNLLPARSLTGAIALAWRGKCALVVKALRAAAAGAVGLVLVDNRPGETRALEIRLPLPAGTISDLDGARLRDLLAGSGGRTRVRIGRRPSELETGRSAIVTSFSSAGPTAFSHLLKPDVSAPGGQILSSTLPRLEGSPFAVFDGTSMAAPHVAGAVAVLLERHRGWTPREVKSALVSTAGPAWANTARTEEAPVVLGGGGLVNLPRADNPRLFTDPVSLSFGDLNVNRGARRRTLLVSISDAGNGSGDWRVELRPQSASAGASLELPPSVDVDPRGSTEVPVAARATSAAAAGDNFGFIVLRRGADVRRIPYYFAVTRPGLESAQPVRLRRFQAGDTLRGVSRASVYRYPSAPFGPAPDYTGVPMREDGAERVYVTHVNRAVANFGVSVAVSAPGTMIHPWVLGSLDENDVQGPAGTPVNVNPLTFDYRLDVGAAAAVFPRRKRFFVSVDAGRDEFTGRLGAGRFVLRSWVNDVRPPRVTLLTRRVAAGRPLLVARVVDAGSGVDPISIVLNYRGALVGAEVYDPLTGLAAFPLSANAPRIPAGRIRAVVAAHDFQETKNVDNQSRNVLPNTTFRRVRIRGVRGPAVTWLRPQRGRCVARQARLLVTASATRPIRAVRFLDGRRRIATVRRGPASLYAATWSTRRAREGRHVLRAVVVDRSGARAAARRTVRVCR